MFCHVSGISSLALGMVEALFFLSKEIRSLNGEMRRKRESWCANFKIGTVSGNAKLIYMNFPPWSNLTIYSVLENFQFLASKPSCSLFSITWPAVKLAFSVLYCLPWLGHGNSQLDQTTIWEIWNFHCPFYFIVLEDVIKHWLLNHFLQKHYPMIIIVIFEHTYIHYIAKSSY